MSTRTIIEINHDYLRTLQEHPAMLDTLLRVLTGSEVTGRLNKDGGYEFCPGVKVFAQRHHSDRVVVVVGNSIRHEE